MRKHLPHGWANGAERVYKNVLVERARQLRKWGPQSHSDFIDDAPSAARSWKESEAFWKYINDARERNGQEASWAAILMEEIAEAFAADDFDDMRKELIECAAVIFAWVEDMDSRGTDESPSSPSLTSSSQDTNVLPFPVSASSTADALSTTTDELVPRSTSSDSAATRAA